MKKLTITTTRVFKTDKDWEDYKNEINEYLSADWEKLEETGEYDYTQHKDNEMVITKLELEEL